jgi:hypothetical protein
MRGDEITRILKYLMEMNKTQALNSNCFIIIKHSVSASNTLRNDRNRIRKLKIRLLKFARIINQNKHRKGF